MCSFDFITLKDYSLGYHFYICMIESAILSIFLAILEVIEFFYIGKYLQDDYLQVIYDASSKSIVDVSKKNLNQKLTSESLKNGPNSQRDLLSKISQDDLNAEPLTRRYSAVVGSSPEKEDYPRHAPSLIESPYNSSARLNKRDS